MIPVHDPIVAYAMVSALIVALAVGIFFASPLRNLLTGPDQPGAPDALGDPDEPAEPAQPAQPAQPLEGPWSTAEPTAERWPKT